jgi:thiamine biosynthesis lipoprotein
MWKRTWQAALTVLVGLAGCASPPPARDAQALQRFEFAEPQMGMPFRIILYAPEAATAKAAASAAFQRVAELNAVLSDYDTDSELSRLSQTAGQGKAVPVSPDLWRVLRAAQALARRTGGAFDVTAGPYVSHWRKARRTRKLPTAEALARAGEGVGYGKLRLDPRSHTAELTVPFMRLDLGGIAKGYALDEALKVLRKRGLPHALVTGGGDMAAGEPPPGRRGWRIAVAALEVTNALPPRFVDLRNTGLATSGDVFQHLDIEGQRYSHIVDPRTGLGLTDHSQVTVIARNAMTADSLATAVSVLGPVAGLRLVEQTPGAAALLARQPGANLEIHESKRWRAWQATSSID